MGVPKFFRYTSERYPCLNELVKAYQIPDFDNMYLDMNGIIHNCSHPDDSNPHFRITEEKIFQDIFHYISILFQIIKPKKLFFMAIDGVAPRAKMNQQRGRRFRSAREAEEQEAKAKAKGETLPSQKRFDSNCITPGTVFMARLHEQLRYFVKQKMSSDPLWAKVRVILSGHETPGEGEHKIMDYIRWARSQPDYNPDTRHCLYGLDADLIMLGMCTHEPHFALLREEVKFGKSTQRASCPEETNFFLLHLSLLRDYLAQEFIQIKDKLPFDYDIEKVVDDWVLMGFLVGNDFIPNLPNMHINNDALQILYKTYMKVLPTLDGYINESGDLNLARFEIFMEELSKIDKDNFQDTYADLKYFEGKTGRRPNARERKEYKPNNDETFNVNIEDIKSNKPDDELQALINATDDMLLDDIDFEDGDDYETENSDEEATFNMEFKLHKHDYYMNKLDYTDVTDEVLASQAEGYVRAIQWNLFYYYKGCPSWCWYYPHHYAPYISDIKGFKDLKIEFELGEPFKPFEQLLAVLPAASKDLLPTPYHSLMTDENSPIFSYYPINFETDLNGKKNDWEAVVLIPFIDEKKLLNAMAPCNLQLTDEERKRNSHGPMLVYDWTNTSQGEANAPEYFPPIRDCHVIEKPVWRDELNVPSNMLVHGMLPNVTRDLVFPGFPTTKHLKYESYLKKCKVKVFDRVSLNENMILKLLPEIDLNPPLETVAKEYLGKIIWVGWPHVTQAKVISVSNEKRRLHLVDQFRSTKTVEYATEHNEGSMHKQWLSERATIIEHNMNRLGIELGDVNVIIHAVNLKGYKYVVEDSVQLAVEPEWCVVPCGYALQSVVTNVNAFVKQTLTRYSSLQDMFPVGDKVFLIASGPFYGSLAQVVENYSSGFRLKLQVVYSDEPIAGKSITPAYHTAHHAAASCGITPNVLSRITGSIFVAMGERRPGYTEGLNKVNLGLNLKFSKKNQEVAGYTRRTYSNAWTYSPRCVELVALYARTYPQLFDKMSRTFDNNSFDIFFEGDLWPGQVGQDKPKEISDWLKKQSHNQATRRDCGSLAIDPECLEPLCNNIQEQIQKMQAKVNTVTLKVKMNLLYKPEFHDGNIAPDPKADFQLYDRVICTSKTITVPLGLKGTIIAVHCASSVNTVRLSDKLNADDTYQVMFDEPFPGGMTEELFDSPRFYRMSKWNLLNISYGRNLREPYVSTHENLSSFTNSPNFRHDGQNSAFASYSPTKDRQHIGGNNENSEKPSHSAVPISRPTTSKSDCNKQDNGTEMLKSLLKISMPSDSNEDKKKQNDTWRNRESSSIPAQKPNNDPIHPIWNMFAGPQVNWRSECKTSVPTKQPVFEQNKNNQFNKVPPKQPTFPPNFTIPPGPPVPRPNQIPLPKFPPYNPYLPPPPHFPPPHNHPHVRINLQFPPAPPRNQNVQVPNSYPGNMPNIGANFVPPANWIQNKQPHVQAVDSNRAKSNPPPSVERFSNPFVPLQVQASQRRVQNTNVKASTSENSTSSSQTKPVELPTAVTTKTTTSEQKPQKKQQNKRRPRIAANFNFPDS